MASSWSKEQVTLALDLWQQGHSGSKIAARPEIAPRTRASVIGLMHRLRKKGVSVVTRPATNRMASKQRALKARSRKPKIPKPAGRTKQPKLPISVWREPAPEIVVPIEERRQVLGADFRAEHGVRDGQCRYIIGSLDSPDWHFCHHEKAFGTSWCITHLRAISQPPESVQRPVIRKVGAK